MSKMRQSTVLAGNADSLGVAQKIIEATNLRLFFRFRSFQPKKRVINKIVGGHVTMGSEPPPIEIYMGPTGRRKLKGPAATGATGPDGLDSSQCSEFAYS